MRKKYYKSRAEAIRVCRERNTKERTDMYGVWKMPKGSRHVGQCAVCSEMEYFISD